MRAVRSKEQRFEAALIVIATPLFVPCEAATKEIRLEDRVVLDIIGRQSLRPSLRLTCLCSFNLVPNAFIYVASTMPSSTSVNSYPDILGSFEFIQDLPLYKTEQPYQVVGNLPPEQEPMRTNTKFKTHQVLIHDLRTQVDSFSFENSSFEVIRQPDFEHFNLEDGNGLKAYLLKMAELLKAKFNADEVIIYNYNVFNPQFESDVTKVKAMLIHHTVPNRWLAIPGRRNVRKSAEPRSTSDSVAHRQVFILTISTAARYKQILMRNSADSTHEGGFRRVRYHLQDDEASKYLDGSWRIRIVTYVVLVGLICSFSRFSLPSFLFSLSSFLYCFHYFFFPPLLDMQSC